MKTILSPINNEKGSVIIYTILILVLLSIIGIGSLNISTTESFIVRNMAIQEQNMQMVNAAVLEALQLIIDMDLIDPVTGLSPDGFTPQDLQPTLTSAVWVNNDDTWGLEADGWYDPDHVGPVLDATNSTVPLSVLNGTVGDGVGSDETMTSRGEMADLPLRYAFLGWDTAPGYSLKATTPTRKSGTVLGEYVSNRYGITKVELGLEKRW